MSGICSCFPSDVKWARMNDTKTKNSDGGKRIRSPWEGKKKKKKKERKEKEKDLELSMLELSIFFFF